MQSFDIQAPDVYAIHVHNGECMTKVSVKEARENLKWLLDQTSAGEEVIILRRGKEVARMVPPAGTARRLPKLEGFRSSIALKSDSLSSEVMRGRRKERY